MWQEQGRKRSTRQGLSSLEPNHRLSCLTSQPPTTTGSDRTHRSLSCCSTDAGRRTPHQAGIRAKPTWSLHALHGTSPIEHTHGPHTCASAALSPDDVRGGSSVGGSVHLASVCLIACGWTCPLISDCLHRKPLQDDTLVSHEPIIALPHAGHKPAVLCGGRRAHQEARGQGQAVGSSTDQAVGARSHGYAHASPSAPPPFQNTYATMPGPRPNRTVQPGMQLPARARVGSRCARPRPHALAQPPHPHPPPSAQAHPKSILKTNPHARPFRALAWAPSLSSPRLVSSRLASPPPPASHLVGPVRRPLHAEGERELAAVAAGHGRARCLAAGRRRRPARPHHFHCLDRAVAVAQARELCRVRVQGGGGGERRGGAGGRAAGGE